MDENQGYYAEVANDRRYHAEAEDDRFHGLAMMVLLVAQGMVWFGIGFMTGLLW